MHRLDDERPLLGVVHRPLGDDMHALLVRLPLHRVELRHEGLLEREERRDLALALQLAPHLLRDPQLLRRGERLRRRLEVRLLQRLVAPPLQQLGQRLVGVALLVDLHRLAQQLLGVHRVAAQDRLGLLAVVVLERRLHHPAPLLVGVGVELLEDLLLFEQVALALIDIGLAPQRVVVVRIELERLVEVLARLIEVARHRRLAAIGDEAILARLAAGQEHGAQERAREPGRDRRPHAHLTGV
ncbi:MAG: hypothetical protein H6705_12485 [Myxococcales bacterium]|nr:hypothetical protein [Myxococcales bacterium]